MPDGSPPSETITAPSAEPTILQKPIHSERHVKVICIGAGASGLLLAYKLQRSFENFSLVLYEKNKDISGTWYENKYPGCACDVPAHTYTWSFEPHPGWSSTYAGSAEIHQYFARFATKYGLSKYCKVNHKVTKAVWQEDEGKWAVEIHDLENDTVVHDSCDILINGSGVLNAWKWPDIPGLKSYKGTLLHTATWDTSVDLKDKHVGLIGNGSSGIQVLPAIHPIVSKVTTFIRSPTWVAPVQGLKQHHYTDEERRNFETNPEAHLKFRKDTESSLNGIFSIFLAGSDAQKSMHSEMTKMMKEALKNEELEKLVIPKWAVGCRRFTPGINYLETLGSEKVQVVYGQVQAVTEKGCIGGDGQEYPVDVLICATGFDTSYKPRFPIVGKSGVSLGDAWKDESDAYIGLAAADFPNYFMFIGPNSPIGNGPVLSFVEAQADYMLKFIDRWQTENIHSFVPKKEAVDDFIAHTDNFMKNTVWQDECRSWYKKNSVSDRVTALWPGSTMHYLEALDQPRYDDWEIKYNGNRFSFLGNGFSQVEVDDTADWAYYIRNEDDGPYMSRGKRRKIYSKSGTVVRSGDKAGLII
ncbi:hypothetical protein D9613_007088 [Agrocybe pediades]|uniref:Sterigmatocystin biosynthesis monooxygenase stcW n=1 Tax=Agrocybe pediades TaxID=84607 RepID=A0A8H4QHB1_9AGAR|nr:hypothetical protein D9613_007088 [Agrocybe pediades]